MEVSLDAYYQARPKQLEAHKDRTKYILFGGAMGGGKSFWLCAEALKHALKYPKNRVALLRREAVTMRRTLWITFQKICPPEIIVKTSEQRMEIDLINGSRVMFMEANRQKDPLLNKIKGLEIGFFGIDEANEVEKEVYDILKTRLRWTLPNDATEFHRINSEGAKCPRYCGRLTSNPEQCWLKDVFVDGNGSESEKYIQSLTTDNYDEDSEYIKTLKEAYKDNPDLLDKYLNANWETRDSVNQLITHEVLGRSASKVDNFGSDAIGVDVARYGKDKSVIVILLNGNLREVREYESLSTVELATKVVEASKEFNISEAHIGVDAVGLGAGTCDALSAMGYDIVEIVGGARQDEQSKGFYEFTNLRAQIYWQLRQDLISSQIGGIDHEKMLEELPVMRYTIERDKKIKLMSKDEIKKILGVSPDYADALAYANWVRLGRGDDGIFYIS